MDNIGAIGGGMQGMMGIQGMQQDFQPLQASQDMKEIQGLENKQAKPEEMHAKGFNQQDKTEMSDEAQANNPFSENKDIDVGNRIQDEAKAKSREGLSKAVKGHIKSVLDKQNQEGNIKLADGKEIPGQKDARIKSGIESFKMLWDNCFKNSAQNLEPEVREAAERLIQGDLNGAAELINYGGEQQDGQGAHANNIIAGIQGMGQGTQQ